MRLPSRIRAFIGLFTALRCDMSSPRQSVEPLAPVQTAPAAPAEPPEEPLNDTRPIPDRPCPPLPPRPRDCRDVDDPAELERWIRETAAYETAFRDWSRWQTLRFLPPQYQINRLPIPRLTPDQIADGRPLWRTLVVAEAERMERAAREAVEAEQIVETELPTL